MRIKGILINKSEILEKCHNSISQRICILRKNDFDKDYGNLVPSASISYAIAPGMNLGVNYSMRITRPGITYPSSGRT